MFKSSTCVKLSLFSLSLLLLAPALLAHTRACLADSDPRVRDAIEYEVRPGDNTTPPVRTLLLVTYDETQVYFAFRALDPDPERDRILLQLYRTHP